jgi:hypothetical protein
MTLAFLKKIRKAVLKKKCALPVAAMRVMFLRVKLLLTILSKSLVVSQANYDKLARIIIPSLVTLKILL